MSTMSAHQQSLADAGSETRPPMFERGSYIPWASQFRRYLNRKRETRKDETEDDLMGDNLKHYEADIEAMNLILISIPNDIYNSVDSCQTAQEMWLRVKRLMHGTDLSDADRETRLNNEFDKFTTAPVESFVNQAVVQAGRVNIQSRNVGNDGRIARRSYNTQVDAKGHYGQDCPKPRVRDFKYFMEQMLLTKKDEARVILSNEKNYFHTADATQMEEIEELSANI
ncbi:hypothetical protein Tco_1029536 [Tanacetum coccineum]|uniref:Uncharacterized protein n=1 Tax=Tanacetum coccineum TaxID=301880 RepID=A0ABQ5G3P2_9ASTR